MKPADPAKPKRKKPERIAWCSECEDGEVMEDGLCELCWNERQREWDAEARETERNYWQSV